MSCSLADTSVAKEIHTGSESVVTSIAILPSHSQLFIASFGDGTMRLYDRRLDKLDPVSRTYNDHDCWVLGVRAQIGAEGDILSARYLAMK